MINLRSSCLALGAAVLASSALAQDDGEMRFDPLPTMSCIAGATDLDGRQACVGLAADACMSDNEEGFTTIGMMSCFNQELDWWDGRLNAIYGDLLARNETMDVEYDDLGSAVPRLVPALRDMQRSWIPFRDAKCEYVQRQWGGGSGGGPAVLACLMTMTGEQALYLEEFLTDG